MKRSSILDQTTLVERGRIERNVEGLNDDGRRLTIIVIKCKDGEKLINRENYDKTIIKDALDELSQVPKKIYTRKRHCSVLKSGYVFRNSKSMNQKDTEKGLGDITTHGGKRH